MKLKRNELISVIMPVRNGADFIDLAIKSILKQTYKQFEFIIIDDGSTDETPALLKKYAKKDSRIRILNLKKKKGLAYALNMGIDKAKGKYIARMDADDISAPERFEKQIAYLKENPLCIAVGAQAELINAEGKVIGLKSFPNDPKSLYKLMFVAMPIQHPLLMTYTRIMKKCRYENHTTAEDVSMFFKLLQYGQFGNVEEVLFQYRVRPDSNSLKNPKKTFWLTFKSRVKAVIDYGYDPSVLGIMVNMAQVALVMLLPNSLMLRLYELWRFRRKVTIQYPVFALK